MNDGGYDSGYFACPCFWGKEPGSLIAELFKIVPSVAGLSVLDVGCGEGKNAYALATRGANVLAVDCSDIALSNGRNAFLNPRIEWKHGDIRLSDFGNAKYDIVIAYGFFHCLESARAITESIAQLSDATKAGGLHVVCAFNSRQQDLSAHPGFNPCLISHHQYLTMYKNWEILLETDKDLNETHPHNLIPHSHSMTRLIARKNIF